MALLRGTQRRASVHADAPRFAGQKIIQKNFEFVAVSKFLCMCSGTFCSTSMGHRCRSPVCGNVARVRNPMRMSFYRPRRVRAWRPRLRWLRYNTHFRRLACLLRSSWRGTASQHTYVPVRMVWPVCISVYILRTSCTYGFVSAKGDSTSISLLCTVCSPRTVAGCLDGLVAIVKKWPQRVPSIFHELLTIDGLLKLRCLRQLLLPLSLLAVHSSICC